MINLYEILGVVNDATPEEITTVYRKLAKQYHPDAGGDKAAFQAISHAYEILSYPDKRKAYDENGTIHGAKNIIESTIVQLVNSILVSETFDCEELNLIKAMCHRIDQQRDDHRKGKAKHESQLRKVKARLDKFNKSNEATKNTAAKELIAGCLTHAIEQLEEAIEADQEGIELGDQILAYMNDIKWDTNLEFTFRGRRSRSAFEGLPNFMVT